MTWSHHQVSHLTPSAPLHIAKLRAFDFSGLYLNSRQRNLQILSEYKDHCVCLWDKRPINLFKTRASHNSRTQHSVNCVWGKVHRNGGSEKHFKAVEVVEGYWSHFWQTKMPLAFTTDDVLQVSPGKYTFKQGGIKKNKKNTKQQCNNRYQNSLEATMFLVKT